MVERVLGKSGRENVLRAETGEQVGQRGSVQQLLQGAGEGGLVFRSGEGRGTTTAVAAGALGEDGIHAHDEKSD